MRRLICLIVSLLAVGASSDRVSFAQQSGAPTIERRAAIEALIGAGRHADAETEARTWLSTAERDSGPESPETAHALDVLVQALSHTNNAAAPESLAFGQRVVDLKLRLFGDAHLEYAESLGHYAHLLHAAMKPGNGDLIDKALAIQLPVLDLADARLRRLITRNLLATWSVRQDERAARVERAVRIAELDGDLVALALGLEQLAIGSRDSKARMTLRERAIALHEQSGHLSVDFAICVGNYASGLAWDGDIALALNALDRAEALLGRLQTDIEHAPPIDQRMHRSAWTILGSNFEHLATRELKQAHYGEALSLVEHGWAIQERTVPRENLADNLPSLLMTVAHAAAGSGRSAQAFDAALRSEAARTAARRSTIREASESTARISYAWGWMGTDVALSLLLDGRVSGADAVAKTWDIVLQSRGLVVDELAERARIIRDTTDPELQRLAANAQDARQRFVNLVMGSPNPSRDDLAIRAVKEARDRAERLLAARVQTLRSPEDPLSVDLDRVAAGLPRGTALVAYRAFKRFHWRTGTPPGTSPGDGDAYAAFVLRAGSAPRLLALGSADQIHRLILKSADLLEEQASSALGPSRMLEQAYRSTAGALRQKVWDPLVPFLAGSTRVFIVPDGALHLVNFAALPIGDAQYLVEQGRPFHYLSAERHLAIAALPPPAGDLLAVGASDATETRGAAGAPAFRGRRAACGLYQDLRFDALPWTGRELRDISSAWTRGTASPVSLLSGAGATEADFKTRAAGKRVLHLATHGFFLIGPCGPEFDRTFEWKDMVFTDIDITNDNPLLLTGFAMAKSDEPGADGFTIEDGVLTGEEIAALNLDGVEWAVLSACDTGLGKVKDGEGMFGLRHAFQIAGVRTVIMSLWQIEDQSAQEWMQRLYERRFVDHRSTVDAVHQATLDVLRARRAANRSTHPVYWAGFVASGDWR